MKLVTLLSALGVVVSVDPKTQPHRPRDHSLVRRNPKARMATASFEVDANGGVEKPAPPSLVGKNHGSQNDVSPNMDYKSLVRDQSDQSVSNREGQRLAETLEDLQQRDVNGENVSADERALRASATTSTTTTSEPPRCVAKLLGSGVDIADVFVSQDNGGAFKTQDTQELATTLLKQQGLIPKTTSCDLCSSKAASHHTECCFQWMQNSVYVSDLTQLHSKNPTELSVFLAVEQGFDPSIIKFARSVQLGNSPYVKLLDRLRHIGVYTISQMSGVDPSELVRSMGYTNGDWMQSMLTARIKEQVDARVARKNSKQSGTEWDAAKLIRKNGLMRGVLISSTAQSTNLQEALQFTPSAAMSTEEALGKAVLLQPDEKTAQLSMQSVSSSQVAKASNMMETFGMSSVKSKSFGISASLTIGTSASISGSYSSSSSDSTKKNQDTSASTSLNSFTKEYTKSIYFVEPRQLVVVDPALLQPTPALKQAFRQVKTSLESNKSFVYSINHLFRDFGTHTCTKAMLGGWWKLTAQESTATAQLGMEMAKEASYALEQTVSKSWSVGVSANFGSGNAGLSMDGSNTNADSESQTAKSGTKRASNHSDIISEVSQEWKGGTTGLAADVWRKSLESSQKWKVIDRYIDSCWGIWRWSDDTELSKKLCKGWNHGFVREMQKQLGKNVELPSEWSDCDGANYLTAAQETLSGRHQEAQKLYKEKKESECLKLPGRHIKNGECVVNKCYCGEKAIPGETGEKCPKDGTMKCRLDQLARCSTMSCPPGYWAKKGAASELCTSTQCSVEKDKATCCQSVKLTDAFTLRIKHCHNRKHSTVCIDSINVRILDRYGRGPSASSQPPKRGAWKDMDLHSASQMQMSQICVEYKGGCPLTDTWCIGEVEVYNKRLPRSPNSLIARSSGGWPEFKWKSNHHCRHLS